MQVASVSVIHCCFFSSILLLVDVYVSVHVTLNMSTVRFNEKGLLNSHAFFWLSSFPEQIIRTEDVLHGQHGMESFHPHGRVGGTFERGLL